MVPSRAGQFIPLLFSAFVAAAGCSKQDQQPSQPAPPVHDRAADESAIRANDSAWVKAVAAKNADQAASYYTDDAVLMVPGEPMTTGKEALRKGWEGMMATPGFALTFAPDKVTVVGDMAYEVGNYEMTVTGKNKKPQTSKAKYVVIWSRQADGSWKSVLDAPTTTP
jgi:uncharacterized protein (TIGR02246 family)